MPFWRLSSKNQITLPKEARKAMNVKSGDELLIVVKGSTAILMPRPKKYADTLFGIAKGIYPKDYLKKERLSW
jgi:AbrB family looped-hinge helix DNA binding protein